MTVSRAVRRVASSLLGRQALLSSVFAVFVLLTLVVQARIPFESIRTSESELGGLDRMASAHALLAAIARSELSETPLASSRSDVTRVLAPLGTPGAEYSAARDRVARAWRKTHAARPKLDALADLASATTLFIVKLSDASQLTYDEDVDGINYGDLLSTQLPRTIDREVRAAAIGMRLNPGSPLDDRMAVVRDGAQADIVWMAAENDFELGSDATKISQDRLRAAHDRALLAYRTLRGGLGTTGSAFEKSRAELRRPGEAFVAASYAYANALEDALREIIAERIARKRASIAVIAALCILTLGLGILAEFSRRRSARQQLALRTETDRARSFEIELVQQRADRARVLNEARFRTIFDNSPVGIATLDWEGMLVERNRAFHEMLDASFAVLDPTFTRATFADVVSGVSPPYQIERAIEVAGERRWIELTVFPIRISDGEAIAAIAMVADVSERREHAERLRHAAVHDALTGLRTRGAFLEHVKLASGHRGEGTMHAVMMIDLDRFKLVNDTFGHAAGDATLTEVSRRLREVLRNADVIARLHGDEFAVLIACRDRGEIAARAGSVLEILRAPIAIAGRWISIDSSIGLCVVGRDDTPEAILHDADTAMYRAKQSGRGRFVFFDEPMREASQRYGRLASDLLANLEAGAFRVVYQPIVDLASGGIEGFEALARWHHPEFGEVGPDEFVRIAEEMGSIDDLGRFVVREACRQAGDWNRRFPELAPVTMSVNLSSHQLDARTVIEVERCLRESGMPGSSLILEITESALVEAGPQVSATFAGLRAAGVRLCLDDFGTGYSSLRYLQQFPVDELKIDRSFVSGERGRLASEPISRMLLSLAASLELTVVAEGIETVEQRDALLALGCPLGQGYLFARPGAPGEFESPRGLELPTRTALEGVSAA